MRTIRLVVTLGIAVGVASGCAKPYHFNIHSINEHPRQQRAVITISDPQIYSRETLVDDRRGETQYLKDLIKESPKVAFDSQLRRDVRSITALAAQLGIAFDPGKGLEFSRAAEVTDLEHQIKKTQLQTQLLEVQTRLKDVEKNGSTGSPNGAAPAPGGSTLPTAKSPGLEETRKIAEQLQNLVTFVLENLEKDIKPARATEVKSTPQEEFRDRQAYREELRAALAGVNLDDLHDLGGNALIRLQFRATVMPGESKDKFGMGRLTVKQPKLSEDDVRQLYTTWLAHVNYRLNQHRGSGTVPHVHYEALGTASGLYGVVSVSADSAACLTARASGKEEAIARDCKPGPRLAVPPDDLVRLRRLDAMPAAVRVLRAAASAAKSPTATGFAATDLYERTFKRRVDECLAERTKISEFVPGAQLESFRPYYALQQAPVRGSAASRPLELQTALGQAGDLTVGEVLDAARAILAAAPAAVAAIQGLPDRQSSKTSVGIDDARSAYDELVALGAEMALLVADIQGCRHLAQQRSLAEQRVPPRFSELLWRPESALDGRLVSGVIVAKGLPATSGSDMSIRGQFVDGRLVDAVVEGGAPGAPTWRLGDAKVRTWRKVDGTFEIEISDTKLTATNVTDKQGPRDLSQVKIQGARLEGFRAVAAGEVYAYATAPIELSQRISTVASAAHAAQLALALSAVVPGKGIGADAAFGYLQSAVGKVEALERAPIIVGFSDRVARSASRDAYGTTTGLAAVPKGSADADAPPPNEDARQFGWVFGPRVIVDPKSRDLRLEHGLVNQQVSADLSVPGWWPRLQFDLETAWIGNWHDVQGMGLSTLRAGDRLQQQPLSISLPPNRADMDGLTTFLARKTTGYGLARAQIDRVVPGSVSACADKVTFLIHGRGIWRSTEVFLAGLRHDDLSVLPDMEGVAATFSLKHLPRRPSRFEQPLLTVWTRNGTDSKEIQITGGEKAGKLECGDEAAEASPASPPPVGAPEIGGHHPKTLQRCAVTATFLVTGKNLTSQAGVYLGATPATSVKATGPDSKALVVNFTGGPFTDNRAATELPLKIITEAGVSPDATVKLEGTVDCPSGPARLAISTVLSVPPGPVDICAKKATLQLYGTALDKVRDTALVVPTTTGPRTIPAATQRLLKPSVGDALVELEYLFPKLATDATLRDVELRLNGNEVTRKLSAMCGDR